MKKKTYTKPHKSYEEQIQLLQERGLEIKDEQRAIKHLNNISYYRLSAYMLPYKKSKNGIIQDNFIEGATWSDVYDLYVFDRKLRILVFDIIERLEISIRTQIIYQLSEKYGSHWQDNRDIFKALKEKQLQYGTVVTMDVFSEIQNHIKQQLNSNKAEVFIEHYRNKYSSPENPPSWMCLEVMYFNHLSKICAGLKKRSDISGISEHFGLPPDIFCSWLHTINYVRNLCAHHSRLWNRDLNIVPKRLSFSKSKIWLTNPKTVQRSKMYYFLSMLNYLLQTSNPNSSFKLRLYELLDDYKHVVNHRAMGFLQDWDKEKMWNFD